jgi:hypothetical protein
MAVKTLVLFGTFEFIDGEVFVRDVVDSMMVEGRSLSGIENAVDKEFVEGNKCDSYLIPALWRGRIHWTTEDDNNETKET